MSKPQAMDQIRHVVESILTILGVTRVVCVDDTYEDAPTLEEVLAAVSHLATSMLRDVLPELGGTIPDDLDILKQQVRELWRKLDDKVRIERTQMILAASRVQDGNKTDDRGDASILSELIPRKRLLTLSPRQWDAQREQLLKEDSGSRSLFLFDQVLSEASGDLQGGMKIIASLLTRKDTGNFICGLLTHTVTPQNQSQRWDELSREHGITRDRFLVVPKQYLSKDPILFAQLLKLIALSPDFSSLKEKTKKILADATGVAANKVDEISIYDLDHIVFRVSSAEGLWEPDMLFRLHSLFHRLESRRRAHEGGELEAIAQRLRSVSHIPTQTDSRPASSTWRLQHEELYESGDYLNQNHLPLDLGDIFVKTGTGSTKRYILLAHPCDLMVRSDGKRHPEIIHVPLAEIVCDDKCPDKAEAIPYFGDDPDKSWFVKLKRAQQVRVGVLDLCVFNAGGEAIIPIEDEPSGAMRPSLRARYPIVAEAFGSVIRCIAMLIPENKDSKDTKRTKEALKKPLSGAILQEGLFNGEIKEKDGKRQIHYNCQRIGRLTRARAFALLLAYTGCQGRPALDRDFGGSIEPENRVI